MAYMARDFPIANFPLSQTHLTLKDPAQLDIVMRLIHTSLGGKAEPEMGRIVVDKEHDTTVQVYAYRDSRDGTVYIEFNRLDGCAFVFQLWFIKAKLAAVGHIEDATQASVEADLVVITRKYSFWYGHFSDEIQQ